MTLEKVRAVADAVLYEGYLLYPYRATSRKNQARWQFGVLGPPAAADMGVGEASSMATQCLLTHMPRAAGAAAPAHAGISVTVRLRFLQLQVRTVERYNARAGSYEPVDRLTVGDRQWLSWDEAVEHEVVLACSEDDLRRGHEADIAVAGHVDNESLTAGRAEVGRIVRRRWPLQARITTTAEDDGEVTRLGVRIANLTPADPLATDPCSSDIAIRGSLIGTHLILEAEGARFVSVIEPPDFAEDAARRCRQDRCWPVLAGEPPGEGPRTSEVVLASPIILYDFPEVAEQSAGALFDSTEIDEILTLRVMTMTEEEKAEARATDAKARTIIDRCDEMSAVELQRLHGVLRNPHALAAGDVDADAVGAGDIRDLDRPTWGDPDVPWWDPSADEAVRPELDAVVIDGVAVSRGSLVRVLPSRRADAQDLFFAGRVARVTAVLSDVEGGVHVALVLADDPAADLHDWYGRYWYFAPDELQPLARPQPIEHREESRP